MNNEKVSALKSSMCKLRKVHKHNNRSGAFSSTSRKDYIKAKRELDSLLNETIYYHKISRRHIA